MLSGAAAQPSSTHASLMRAGRTGRCTRQARGRARRCRCHRAYHWSAKTTVRHSCATCWTAPETTRVPHGWRTCSTCSTNIIRRTRTGTWPSWALIRRLEAKGSAPRCCLRCSRVPITTTCPPIWKHHARRINGCTSVTVLNWCASLRSRTPGNLCHVETTATSGPQTPSSRPDEGGAAVRYRNRVCCLFADTIMSLCCSTLGSPAAGGAGRSGSVGLCAPNGRLLPLSGRWPGAAAGSVFPTEIGCLATGGLDARSSAEPMKRVPRPVRRGMHRRTLVDRVSGRLRRITLFVTATTSPRPASRAR